MRLRRPRSDHNLQPVIKELRDLGFSVVSLSAVGDGTPDLLVGAYGRNWLFELKNPKGPPSSRKLTPAEESFRILWKGQSNVITTAQEAAQLIEYLRYNLRYK